ncbi:MAG: restriction endonuclease subunit S [Sedimentisphaerales bacterium]
MKGWKEEKLANTADIYSGFAFKSSDLTPEDVGYPVIKIAQIQNKKVLKNVEEYFPLEKYSYKLQKYKLYNNDTLIAMTGAGSVGKVGKMHYVDRDYLVNQRVAIIRAKSKQLCEEYLYYFLAQEYIERSLYDLGLGAGQPNISPADIGRIDFYLPPLPIQRKIAAVLSAYDDLIENNNRRIAILEKMAEQLYREWFVCMRFTGHEKTKIVKGVPEGWEVKRVGEIVSYYIGGGWGEEQANIEYPIGGYVIRGTDIPDLDSGSFLKPPYRFHKASNYSSRQLKVGDIVFEVSGGSKDQLLGRSLLITKGIFEFCEAKVICASFCKLIRLNQESISSYYFKYFLKLYHQSGMVGTYQIQSTGISNYQFEKFLKYQEFVLPPRAIQDEFDKNVMPILSEKDTLSLVTNILKQSRDRLLSRLMSGKIDVEKMDIKFPVSMMEDAACA